MSDVFDLDAFIADAAGEPFRFRFGGDEYTLPPSIDLRAVAALTAGRLDDAFRLLFTADQWDRIQRSTTVFDQRTLLALFDAYAKHSGTSLGESQGSASS